MMMMLLCLLLLLLTIVEMLLCSSGSLVHGMLVTRWGAAWLPCRCHLPIIIRLCLLLLV